MMKNYSHTARHYSPRKAILEYYSSTNKLLRRKEFKIEHENRFLFHGLELDQLYVSYSEDFEIVIYEEFFIKEIDGKNYYVVKGSNEPVPQHQIDFEVIKKLNRLPLDSIPKFLYYQLKKYQVRKTQLNNWKKLIVAPESFIEPINMWLNKDAQQIALKWVESRIRSSNLRSFKEDKDVPFEDLFISNDGFESVLVKLAERDFITYNHFIGRYEWLKKGQDLAILGVVLMERDYLYDWANYSIRYNALTKFFNVRGKKGFGERTFRKSTITDDEYVKTSKTPQFKFIRYAL